MAGVLIKNGTVVSASGSRSADVRCAGGTIVEIGDDLDPGAGETTIDAAGLEVLPGGVDPHVHMQLPVAGTVSSDDFESGTAAALAGGTTTIIDFVHPERGQPFAEALAERRREAEAATCDYGFHMAVTWWGEQTAGWMADCVEAGLPTFKIYLAYKDVVGIDDGDVVRALAVAAELPAMVIVHAEHGEMVEHLRDGFAAAGKIEPRYHALSRPPQLEGEATHRIAVLAGTCGARLYVVHVTCADSVAAVAAARERGWDVHGETCPQYLLLDDSVYQQGDFEGAAYVIAPPIRPAGHAEPLWDALEEGVLEVVATDHCPFTMEQKRLGERDFRHIPGGAAGVQHRLALLHTHGVAAGRFGRERFVELVSTAPARLFGLYPRKGTVRVGSDADLVVWDPQARAVVSAATDRHNCDRSIYEGFEVRGQPVAVVAGGEIRLLDGELRAERGAGRFLRRSLRSEIDPES